MITIISKWDKEVMRYFIGTWCADEMDKSQSLICSTNLLSFDMLESYINWESILLISMGLEEALWEWRVTYALILDYLIDLIDL